MAFLSLSPSSSSFIISIAVVIAICVCSRATIRWTHTLTDRQIQQWPLLKLIILKIYIFISKLTPAEPFRCFLHDTNLSMFGWWTMPMTFSLLIFVYLHFHFAQWIKYSSKHNNAVVVHVGVFCSCKYAVEAMTRWKRKTFIECFPLYLSPKSSSLCLCALFTNSLWSFPLPSVISALDTGQSDNWTNWWIIHDMCKLCVSKLFTFVNYKQNQFRK